MPVFLIRVIALFAAITVLFVMVALQTRGVGTIVGLFVVGLLVGLAVYADR